MPRFPAVSSTVDSMRTGVFSKVAHRIAGIDGEKYPLHVGDTWLEPANGCHMSDFSESEHPGMHTYAPPRGHPALLSAIEDVRGFEQHRVIVCAGATGGLGALACATISPGEEVIILSPFWPLIRGVVQLHHGVAVEAPILGLSEAADIVAVLESRLSSKTAAIYVNTPNNPTGLILSTKVLTAIADFAARHDLWIWSDEVYEDLLFDGETVPMAQIAPERTFSVHSFSKVYGMAGNRVGFVVGPNAELMASVRKATIHHFYSACTASQLAAATALRTARPWLDAALEHYRAAGQSAADALGLPHPQGGTFLFIDVAQSLDERGLHGFMNDCIDKGLILAPGDSCGQDYGTHVRLCFTSAPPDVVARGVQVLVDLLRR
jgi:aspartate/methionine/tyrosine aminotransferase